VIDSKDTCEGARDIESSSPGTSAPVAKPDFAPSGEPSPLPPIDPELFERARQAMMALRGQGRRVNGQAGRGNTMAIKTGLRSTQLLAVPDIAAFHREQVQAITADLGGDAELSALCRVAIREAARVEVILAALGDELLEHGVLTGKGRTRSATSLYLKTLDRFLKVSGVLGLERRARRVPTLAEYLDARTPQISAPTDEDEPRGSRS
jgi:hypothetical protein